MTGRWKSPNLKPFIESPSQEAPAAELSASVVRLRRLLRGAPGCMLTTQSDHTLQARPMLLRTIDEDGRLWFFASQQSDMVADLSVRPEVGVTFINRHDDLYIAISGRAEVRRDRVAIRRLWKWSYRVWYPGRWRDPDLVLLAVTVTRAEYWSASSTVMTRLGQSLQALCTRRPQNDAQHGVVMLHPNDGPE
jgi:general stress protein 26